MSGTAESVPADASSDLDSEPGRGLSNPFPGPQPYRAADKDSFFGREDISQKLLNRILAAPCVTLFGPSGSGKSSLMQASVIPALMKQYGFRVVRIDGWLVGDPPLERLVDALFVQLELGEPPEEMTPRELLDEALRLAERRSERPILIFLDQLEQPLLPDRSAEQLHELLEGLETLAVAPVRGLQLVLALREDYLGRFRDEARGNRALQDPGFRLGPLKVKEMTEVAYKVLSTAAPAPKWSFDELRALLIQVRTAGQSATDEAEIQAAFAQIVCRKLWEEQRTGNSTAGPVEAEPILHRYLDATLDSLGPLRPAALTLLEDYLVARDGSRTLLTQREAEEVLPAGGAAAQVLDTLERAAVLHAEQHQGGRYFELGHDWLAKKVIELKRERLQAEERALKSLQESLRRKRENASQRKLLILTGAATSLAVLLLGLFIWGLGAQLHARANEQMAFNLSLMAGAREQMQRGQPAIAAKLLAEVSHPEKVEDWEELALESLDSNFLEVTLQGPSGEAFNAASFSPDGEHIVTASDNGTARVWQTDNHGMPLVLVGHTGPVISAEFSQDGRFIVTASQDGTARLWSVKDAEMLRVFQHEGPVRSAGFSPDGQRIVTVSRTGGAQVWRTDDSSNPLEELGGGFGKPVNFAVFSPDSNVQRIVTTTWDRTAQVWQADGTERFSLRQEFEGHKGPVVAAAFSRDGQRIVTASQDGTAHLWRAAGPGASFEFDKQLVGHEGPLQSVAFSPTGRFIVTASQDGSARVWRIRASGAAVVIKILKGHTGPVTAATAFDRSGQDDLHVVTASLDGTARVWHADLKNQPVVTHVMDHLESVTDAGYSPDGESIVTASQDGVARVWRADGSQQPLELMGHTSALTSAAFSPDPNVQRIVTTSWDRTARVWELRSGRWEARPSLQHPVSVQSASFSSDGQRIVTAGYDGVARVWQIDNSKRPIELKGYTSPLTDAAFSPDGQFVVTASRDRTARVWHADGSGETRTLRGHMGSVTSAAFSPDGRLIVTTSQDGTGRVWQAEGGGHPLDEPPRVLRHEGPVQSATFSWDGQFIVTTSWDATARVWRADGTGHPRVLKGHEGPVRSAAFRRDDQRLVTAAWDGTARIWRLPELTTLTPEAILQQLQERNRDCLPAAMRQAYLKKDEEEAREGYAQCERKYERVPAQGVALRSESRAAGSPRRM